MVTKGVFFWLEIPKRSPCESGVTEMGFWPRAGSFPKVKAVETVSVPAGISKRVPLLLTPPNSVVPKRLPAESMVSSEVKSPTRGELKRVVMLEVPASSLKITPSLADPPVLVTP